MKSLFFSLTALACAGLLAVSACAEAAAPALTGESSATAGTRIYRYEPLAWSGGSIKGDAVRCTVTERVRDDRGNLYLVTDSAPLADAEQFLRKTEVTIGANSVRSIAPESGGPEDFTGSFFRVALEKDVSGTQAVITFENAYTARRDTTLRVRPAKGGGETALAVQKGARLISVCKLVLNDETAKVTAYPEVPSEPYQRPA